MQRLVQDLSVKTINIINEYIIEIIDQIPYHACTSPALGLDEQFDIDRCILKYVDYKVTQPLTQGTLVNGVMH